MSIDINYFDDRIIEEGEEIVYVGTFGEDLRFRKVDDNKWTFWSIVLRLSDIQVNDEGKKSILIDYCYFNNKDFDLKRIFEFRIKNSYELTKKYYYKYVETNNQKYLNLLYTEILHIWYYKLSKTDFRWYIIEEYDEPGLVSKEKRKLFFKIRKEVNKEMKKRGHNARRKRIKSKK